MAKLIKLTPNRDGEIHLAENNSVSNFEEKCKYWSSKLSKKFPSKVTVKLNNKGSGRVVIHVDSPDEVEWLLNHVNID